MSNGSHVLLRCPQTVIPGNKKLARKQIEVSGPGQHEYEGKKYQAQQRVDIWYIYPVAIETRGQGGYAVVTPSPGYSVIQPGESGSFYNFPEITAAEREILIRCAKALDEYPPEPTKTSEAQAGGRPGEDFNVRGEVFSLLLKHGWKEAGQTGERQHLTRPGKDQGVSATLFDEKVLHVFSSNALPFESDKSYSPFGIYTLLEHNGDFSSAARDLSRQDYGSKTDMPVKQLESGNQPDFEWECITLENIYTEKIEEKPIIKGLLYELEQTIIYSPGGVGKSLVTQDIAMGLGCDIPFLWGESFEIPKPRNTLFVQSENSRFAVHKRSGLKCLGNPPYLPGLPNIIYASQGKSAQMAGHISSGQFRTKLIKFAKRAEQENEFKIDVIVFDPLISYHDAEENDNSRMRTTLDCILQVSNEIDATAIVAHHANKEQGIRGASAISDWARNIIKLEDVSYRGEKRIKFTHEKCNNSKMFEPFILAMDEYLNFSPIELKETAPKNEKNRGLKVKEALELLGGSSDTKGMLANQYSELSGIKSRTTAFRHVDEAVKNGFISSEFYEEGNLKQARYWVGIKPYGF